MKGEREEERERERGREGASTVLGAYGVSFHTRGTERRSPLTDLCRRCSEIGHLIKIGGHLWKIAPQRKRGREEVRELEGEKER